MPAESLVEARAPGRVNLIGDHTDYAGGLVLPMAIDRATTVVLRRGGDRVELSSDAEPEPAVVALAGGPAPAEVRPPWARYVAGVVAVLHPAVGGTGTVRSDVPVGAGLSSSAALEVAVALAVGAAGSPVEVARQCQHAEHLASGVPCGIMDQLCSTAGVEGHGLLIDCATLTVTPVPLPAGVEILVVHSGQARALAGSAYAERRAQVEAAAAVLGRPLAAVPEADVDTIDDDLLRRRARHVVSENERVRRFAAALAAGELAEAGRLMVASHHSLATDFDVSTPVLDALVDGLVSTPGVYGARLTGAGFGGCAVALVEAGRAAAMAAASPTPAWVVRAAGGARVQVLDP